MFMTWHSYECNIERNGLFLSTAQKHNKYWLGPNLKLFCITCACTSEITDLVVLEKQTQKDVEKVKKVFIKKHYKSI